jgi:uncharacterized protein YjbJ (UPF0337 family)
MTIVLNNVRFWGVKRTSLGGNPCPLLTQSGYQPASKMCFIVSAELFHFRSGSPSDLTFPRSVNMDEDRIAGTARKLGGKVEEEVGRFTGDSQTQIKGMANQAAGAAQDLYGQAADAARDTAATFDKWLRNTIETQPYAIAVVALGIGWLLGRMHRPL